MIKVKKFSRTFAKILALSLAFAPIAGMSNRIIGMEKVDKNKMELMVKNNGESVYEAITNVDVALLELSGFEYPSSNWSYVDENLHSPECSELFYDTKKGKMKGPLCGVWEFVNSKPSIMDNIHRISRHINLSLEEILYYLYNNKVVKHEGYDLSVSQLSRANEDMIRNVHDLFCASFLKD